MKFFEVRVKIAVVTIILCIVHNAQSVAKSPEWFAANCVFPMLEYDLLEVQPYAGMHLLNPADSEFEGIYIPVNLGFRKSFLQWEMLSFKFDLALGAASYTQFEIIRFDEKTFRGGLLNTDFKASGFLFAEQGRSHFRLQLFHISSHLGDDYMLRNQDFALNDKSVNYEQIDITYLYSLPKVDFYLGIGQVITPNSFRKRFMTEAGFQGNFPLKPNLDLTIGSDVKLYEENDFAPDIHSGIGIAIKQRDKQQINFSIDAYFGKLPYSTLDFGNITWIGLSTRLYL